MLTVHVSTAVALVGVDLVLLALGISGLRGSEPAVVYPAMHTVAAVVLAPLALAALGTGVLQGLLGEYGLFRRWWVTAKLAITTVLTALVLLVVEPGLGRAADSPTGAAAASLLTDGQRAAYVATPAVTLVLLVLMVALGMYKPRRRQRNS